MKFPGYWAQGTVEGTDQRGRRMEFTCWGWSDNSVEDAERKGQERAFRAADRLRQGLAANRYAYADRPLREEVLEERGAAGKNSHAVITRNSYGCHVLNTACAMFVDIDLPEEEKPKKSSGLWKKLFGKVEESPKPDIDNKPLMQIESVLASESHCSVRIYRTKAGFRLLFTNQPMDPMATETISLMERLNADPLYINLCRVQECFRARLTPKPWRCGVGPCNERYPWRNPKAEQAFRKWEAKYNTIVERFAVCQFIKSVGRSAIHHDLAAIVELHDRLTKADTNLPLA